jgi:hypothetical protein
MQTTRPDLGEESRVLQGSADAQRSRVRQGLPRMTSRTMNRRTLRNCRSARPVRRNARDLPFPFAEHSHATEESPRWRGKRASRGRSHSPSRAHAAGERFGDNWMTSFPRSGTWPASIAIGESQDSDLVASETCSPSGAVLPLPRDGEVKRRVRLTGATRPMRNCRG